MKMPKEKTAGKDGKIKLSLPVTECVALHNALAALDTRVEIVTNPHTGKSEKVETLYDLGFDTRMKISLNMTALIGVGEAHKKEVVNARKIVYGEGGRQPLADAAEKSTASVADKAALAEKDKKFSEEVTKATEMKVDVSLYTLPRAKFESDNFPTFALQMMFKHDLLTVEV